MHQLIFAALGTVLTVLWGYGFSLITEAAESRSLTHHDGAWCALWALGQFAIILVAVSLGGVNG